MPRMLHCTDFCLLESDLNPVTVATLTLSLGFKGVGFRVLDPLNLLHAGSTPINPLNPEP